MKPLKLLIAIIFIATTVYLSAQTTSQVAKDFMIISSGDCQFGNSNGYIVDSNQVCANLCAEQGSLCQGYSFNERLIGRNQQNCFLRSGSCSELGRDLSSGFQFYNHKPE
ncbi:MAG: hypothetical protein KBD64_01260 [Gammaproteobacteria bacterium]|nr:hypothetical protein [Gammaproteobacteria bacterium]